MTVADLTNVYRPISVAVIRDSTLSPLARTLYAILATGADQSTMTMTVSQPGLTRATGAKAGRVRVALAQLVDAGHVTIAHQGPTTATYAIAANPHGPDATNAPEIALTRPRPTHCPKGHEQTDTNTSIDTDRNGHEHRRCLPCQREYAARRRAAA